MQDIPFAQILVLIIFILLPLLTWLPRRLGRRRERQTPQPQSMPELRRRTTVSEPGVPTPQPMGQRIESREAPPGPATAQRSEIPVSSLFRTRAEMRRAIILMTVLGPCRFFEPPQ